MAYVEEIDEISKFPISILNRSNKVCCALINLHYSCFSLEVLGSVIAFLDLL